jgi:putative peptidoglycan lipid II flippase
LALATSLSSTLNLILLFWKLNSRIGKIDMRKNVKALFRDFLCSLPMGVAAYFICSMGNWAVSGHIIEKACLLGLGIVIGLGIYLACSFWTKNEEMIFLWKLVRKRK